MLKKQEDRFDISLTELTISIVKDREWDFVKKYILNNTKYIDVTKMSIENKLYLFFKFSYKILTLKKFHLLSTETRYLLSYISLYYLALIKKNKKNTHIDIKVIYRNFIHNYNKDVPDVVSFKSLVLKNYSNALMKNEISEMQYNIFIQDFLSVSHNVSCRKRISKKSLEEMEDILK